VLGSNQRYLAPEWGVVKLRIPEHSENWKIFLQISKLRSKMEISWKFLGNFKVVKNVNLEIFLIKSKF